MFYQSFNTASGKHYCNLFWKQMKEVMSRFNTASGKHYCNVLKGYHRQPQILASFNTASGKHYCNSF